MGFVIRALRLPLVEPLPSPLHSLLVAYRLLTNEILREALISGKTSLRGLSRFARDRALLHQVTGTYALTATSIALSLVASHRKRERRGISSGPPYVRRAFLRADDQSFHLDVGPSRVRISLSNGVWSSFPIRLSVYHRQVLATPGLRLKQLHLTEDRAVLIYEKPAPEPYVPTTLLALDSNERSLDGVSVAGGRTHAVAVPFPEVAVVQQRHVDRRRTLARKKARDRRVGRRLLDREGRREHHRVNSRLHLLSKQLIAVAARHRAALALEDFTKIGPRRRHRSRWKHGGRRDGSPRSPNLRRRLSSWPRAELHRQLEYKAAERGVPIIWVNPFRTSTTCPRCGAYGGPRTRMGPVFDCASCGWRLDRQLNAGANIGKIALRETPELGGLELDLDALSEDAVTPLYPFQGMGRARAERREREGATANHRRVRQWST